MHLKLIAPQIQHLVVAAVHTNTRTHALVSNIREKEEANEKKKKSQDTVDMI